MEYWEFLLDPENRAALGLIGTTIAALALGKWAVYTFHKKIRAGQRSIRSALPTSPTLAAK